jgi:glycosyltransferase involved in cell wall biosynthesis
MIDPLVSVVIPVKNGVPLIGDTIQSVLNQSYKNIEVIVVNDHSDDDTFLFVKDMVKDDGRLKLIDNQTEKRGAPVCRNIGYKAAHGKYVIFLDADDLLSINCIHNRVKKIESNPECDFFVFQCELFKEVPGDIGLYWNYFSSEDDLDRFIRVDTPWHTSGPIWKKSAIIAIGGWDETVLTWQDWEFHIRALIANLGYKKEAIADFYYRKEVKNSISSQDGSVGRNLYFSELYKKIYIYLVNGEKLTKKRKDYLLHLFFKRAHYSMFNFNDVNLTIKILKNANKIDLINNFSVYFIAYMLFMLTRKNYLSKKIGWYALKDYILKANIKNKLQNSYDLSKE